MLSDINKRQQIEQAAQKLHFEQRLAELGQYGG